jgi:hypothetical protein
VFDFYAVLPGWHLCIEFILRRLFRPSRSPEEEGAPVPVTVLQESGSAFPFGVLDASLLPAAPSSGRFWSLLCGKIHPGRAHGARQEHLHDRVLREDHFFVWYPEEEGSYITDYFSSRIS